MKISLYFAGKPRDRHANAIAAEYVKRTSRWARIEMAEIHPARIDLWTRHPAAAKILCDPAGKPLDTPRFAALIERLETEGRDAVFVVGGHDGLPEDWKHRADHLIALSPMTFPHELARAMLAEQIYRAFTILRGHPYPR
ncbi:MAG: 23S rRNA (pseudouridine(1915)-N(3))-methyltransferase RlmH [Bryobacteraceae bacterium]